MKLENIAGAKPEHQIYLDESGINTNLTRHYAHAVHGKRAIDATPINTPAGTTVLSSIRLNGSLVYTTYQGGTTAQRFREYMKEQLIPSLEKDDVVIMDHMRSHHAKIVTELLDKAGISYMYLPPYSPNLNPIEKMWSKVTAREGLYFTEGYLELEEGILVKINPSAESVIKIQKK